MTDNGTAADQILDDLIAAQQEQESASIAYDQTTQWRNTMIVKARKAGTPVTRIAELTGMSRQTVHEILKRAGLTRP
ncbi:helix-turn-helix domain-containing protein [Brachybacterium paraconglomeratum]|uniref:helix-turn-helix domain-containing protein n=1 Tax=Brachybacterium paraconglomeratum TaxID=173362 RepID=UPI0022AE5B01|nr:helix-turn-helix domain-containing protein [Brachybacterium paraconglomeratum]MCZ4325655.1 helix-turn-helix domain-containing protein [Brachybacterium paraconglomeratum]